MVRKLNAYSKVWRWTAFVVFAGVCVYGAVPQAAWAAGNKTKPEIRRDVFLGDFREGQSIETDPRTGDVIMETREAPREDPRPGYLGPNVPILVRPEVEYPSSRP